MSRCENGNCFFKDSLLVDPENQRTEFMTIAYIPVYVSVVNPLIFPSKQGIGPGFGRSKNIFHEIGTIVDFSLVKQAEA